MSANISFPTISRDAQDQFRTSADELVEALDTARRHAGEYFRSNPTVDAWHAWVRTHAAWHVAFLAEEDEGQP